MCICASWRGVACTGTYRHALTRTGTHSCILACACTRMHVRLMCLSGQRSILSHRCCTRRARTHACTRTAKACTLSRNAQCWHTRTHARTYASRRARAPRHASPRLASPRHAALRHGAHARTRGSTPLSSRTARPAPARRACRHCQHYLEPTLPTLPTLPSANSAWCQYCRVPNTAECQHSLALALLTASLVPTLTSSNSSLSMGR